MQSIRPDFRPPAADDVHEAGTLVLRDGSQLKLERAVPEDARQIGAFLERLPDRERREVVESLQLEEGLENFLERLTARKIGEAYFAQAGSGEQSVVALGAFSVLEDEGVAAITLAVAPKYRKMGVGTVLLERLAVLAAQRGVNRLIGHSHGSNEGLIELFENAGFETEERREAETVEFTLDTRSAMLSEGAPKDEGMKTRVFTAATLRPLFHPKSVAVVGASRDKGGVGRRILDGLVAAEFEGPVYPVNPKAGYVGSIRAYSSVSEIVEQTGDPVDLAVIATPASTVHDVVEDCAEAGVRGLVVITAGFAETGEEGKKRQDELLEQVQGHGMRMVGPNCLGLMQTSPDVRMNASFAPQMPESGAVALGSQSGALGIAIIAQARQLGLGLSSFVSVGNKADVSGNDLLEYWEEDEATDVILFYLESFGNPRRFARLARRVGRKKPIVTVKSGRTEAGSQAASSHTAALTAADTAVEALFRQTGIIRADTLEEMFGFARTLSQQPLPRGRRVAVVTNAGGPAILCVDALEASGMSVERPSEETQETLREFLPSAASVNNPIDMIASAGPETYRRAVETMLADEEVDAVVVIYTPVGMFELDDVQHAILDGVEAGRRRNRNGNEEAQKPVLASVVGADEQIYNLSRSEEGSEESAGEKIPAYPFPEEMGQILGKISDYADWCRSDPGLFPEFDDQAFERARGICRDALEERGEGWLAVDEAREVLSSVGLQVASGGVAQSADEAVELADSVGYPVAVKLASLQITHKTEIGGVKLGLEDADAVREAYRDIERRLEEEGVSDAMEGALVQPMLSGTAEIMLGVNRDPVFDAIIAFGLGGIHVEILRDVAFRVSPLTDRDAREMIEEIRGYKLLQGYRGYPAADIDALEEALLRVSRMVETIPEIAELDCNPVFALEPGEGYRIVDARIKVEEL